MITAVIVVCGTYKDWVQFQNCVNINDILYLPLLNNEYNKMLGLEKYTTSVLYIGSWKERITEETEKFLRLFIG